MAGSRHQNTHWRALRWRFRSDIATQENLISSDISPRKKSLISTWLFFKKLFCNTSAIIKFVGFGDFFTERKDELTNLMSAFKSNSAVIQQKLKIYFVDMTEKEREDESSAAARARRTQYSTLFFLFTQTINDCHSAQLDYLEKEKAKLGRLLKISKQKISIN